MYVLLLGEGVLMVPLSTAVPSLVTRASPRIGPSALLLSPLLRRDGEQSSSDASTEDDTICVDRSRCRASSLLVLAL